ncbi:antitoxin VbhA family protein [Bacillus mobilis]|uniref:antitoxin VbhA family protein n=1 Tax=Bacillus mobilis TaxID=2026190 RepID=UPI001E2C6F19|nr:antitoxin VbhA family protein [Bacillus mobilis]MCC2463334.1 antitoxin VbhA family protein [Bacillus mobilis]MCU5435385.1 antitoxin VbhA family protein [Bacillus mobilis]
MAFNSEEELNEAIQEAKASLAIEGMIITKEMEKVVKEKLAGKITHEQLITLADAIARRERT